MKKNYAFDIAFEVISENEPDKITKKEFKEALLERIKQLDEEDIWEEAIGLPFDSYDVD